MSGDKSSTTIIFVPGAFHSPECFDKLAHKLGSLGYKIDYVRLASVGPKEHLRNAKPDIDVIRTHTEVAVNTGQKVVMVMHSYAGFVTCDAVNGLDYRTRTAAGQAGGVTHLFFMASLIIPAGISLIETTGGNDAPWYEVADDKMSFMPIKPEELFYNDLPEDIVKDCVAGIQPSSYQVVFSRLEYAAWKDIPSTYLYCTKDNVLPLSVQEMMVNETAKGVDIRTERVESGHSPFLSKPDETATAIQRAAELPV